MAAQPLDPYFLPGLVLMADGQDRTAGRYRQDLHDHIQANPSLRRESWLSPRHEQFRQLALLVAAGLVKAGFLSTNADGVLSITKQGSALLATHPKLITFDDLSKHRHVSATSSAGLVVEGGSVEAWWFTGDVIHDLLDTSWAAVEGVLASLASVDWT